MLDAGKEPTTVALIAGDGTEVVVGHVDARRPDLSLVDVLARLQLTAGRHGWVVLVRGAPEGLRALLDLVGLADVLALELRRKPEGGEQLGVEEVVEPRDPSSGELNHHDRP